MYYINFQLTDKKFLKKLKKPRLSSAYRKSQLKYLCTSKTLVVRWVRERKWLVNSTCT